MGNLESMLSAIPEITEENKLEKIDEYIDSLNNMSNEEKNKAKVSFRKLIDDIEKIKADGATKMEKFMKDFNIESQIYEGSCGFDINDPEGQRILDKYLPRDLNNHAKDMINIFRTTSFKELRESKDRYPESAFWSSPINWIFLSHDEDFQSFMRKENIDIEKLISETHHDKNMLREILNYIYKI